MTALLWVGTLFILAGQLIAVAVAFVLQAVAGIPKIYGCLIGGAVMTSYFAAGGRLSSAWVNLVQLAVLVMGFVLVLPVALSTVGGLSGLTDATAALSPDFMDPWRGGSPALRYIALLVPAFIVSPGSFKKCMARATRGRCASPSRRSVSRCCCSHRFRRFSARARSLSGAREPRLGASDAARGKNPSPRGGFGLGRDLLGRGELGGRDFIHAGDVVVEGSLSAFPSPWSLRW